jgi:streptogramin lyase
MSPHDDLGPIDPEYFSDPGSNPNLRIATLETVLSRPPSWRKRLFLSGVMLVLGAVVLVSVWRGLIPVLRHALVSITPVPLTPVPLTPVPLTPTPTLTLAGRVSATIPLGAVHEHTFVAASDTAVWVHDGPTGTVTRIDPATNTVVAKIAIDANGVGSIVIDQQAVWVANGDTGVLSRIDPQRNQVTAAIRLAPGAGMLGTSPGAIWVINPPNDTVTRIDERTNRVVAMLSIPTLPIGVTFGAGSVWVCIRQDARVMRIDPQTNQVLAQIDVSEDLGLSCNGDLKVTTQGVWVPIFDSIGPSRQHLLERIDPATNKVTDLIGLGADMNPSIAADDRGVWVCDPTSGLFRVDPQSRRVVAYVQLPGGDSMALGDSSLWLTRTSDNSVVRITPAP